MRPEVLALEQPSAYGVGTARAIAKVFGILANGGKTTDGRKLLSSDIIKKITREAVPFESVDRTAGVKMAINLGFALNSVEVGLIMKPGFCGKSRTARRYI